ncbi:hypothetical protein PMI02_04133 [Novosphingobium sp. AP12]|nr:hypothetical protein PMI02_04133 [Novosphingobium sp. AP12]
MHMKILQRISRETRFSTNENGCDYPKPRHKMVLTFGIAQARYRMVDALTNGHVVSHYAYQSEC